MENSRPLKPVPISAAKQIAKAYGYDQVLIYARRVGEEPNPYGEHVTTYGINKEHCAAMATIADHFKFNVMNWAQKNTKALTRPKLNSYIVVGLREMADAHEAMAETPSERQEAQALAMLLDWYGADK